MYTYTYIQYIHTTCCGHIVINIIYTYIRRYVIGRRRRGAQAQRVNVSAPGGRAHRRRDARGMSGDFFYIVFLAEIILRYYFYL